MNYIIYKITNIINNKIYIGSHKTQNIDDSYMGSGKYLNSAINKHGLHNFIKEILFVFDNSVDMYAKEAELVNIEFIKDDNTYNLKEGGHGGFDYINSTGKNLYGKNGLSGFGRENLNKSITADRMKQQGRYEEYVNNISNGLIAKYASGELISHFAKNNPMNDPELKQKHKDALQKINHQQGKKNSQYGTKWIHNIESNISKKMHINEALPIGWAEGRTAKIINYTRIKAAEIKKQQTTMQYNAWYKIYSKLGFTEFVLQTGYDKSQPNLVSMFSKYATNYIPQNGKCRRVVPI